MYAAFLLKHRHIGKTLTSRAYIFGHKANQVESANYLTVGRNLFTESCFSEQQSRCAKTWEIIRFGANSHGTKKSMGVTCEQDFITVILSGFDGNRIFHDATKRIRRRAYRLRFFII